MPAGTAASASPPGSPPAPPPAPPLSPQSPTREFLSAFNANRGALVAFVIFAAVVLGALFAPWLAPHNPVQQFRDHMLTPPLWQAGGLAQFPLGTDELGRCLLSRLLFGARVSLLIGAASVLLALLPGVALGLVAAFHPKWISPVIMRLMDILLALPGLLLAIAVITILGPLIVNATLSFSSAILETAALGFLGLGVQPPLPEWGSMLSAARDYIERAPWVVTMPGLTILITVLAINLMGDGLRDALDPKLRSAA